MPRFAVIAYQISRSENASIHLAGCRDIKRNAAENAGFVTEVEGTLQDAIDSYLDEEMREMGWDESCLKIHNCAKHADKIEEPVLLNAKEGAKRLTCKTVTKALRQAGLNGELVRGNGFYYFAGTDFEGMPNCTILTRHIDAFTIDEWVAKAEAASNGEAAKRDEAQKLIDDDTAKEAIRQVVSAHEGVEFALTKPSESVVEDLHKRFALKFYEIEHEGDLDDAVQALASVGCKVLKSRDIDFESESAVIEFETLMSLAEVKGLLAHTNVVL